MRYPLRHTQGRPLRGHSILDHDATVIGSAASNYRKRSVSAPPNASAERQTGSARAVLHWKTVAIRPNTPLYPGPGGRLLLFQVP